MIMITLLNVTPLVGVWIETNLVFYYMKIYEVTPLVGVWIETTGYVSGTNPPMGHTSRRCVDWNQYRCGKENTKESHTSRRCVDWNVLICSIYFIGRVTPLVGVWIETLTSQVVFAK